MPIRIQPTQAKPIDLSVFQGAEQRELAASMGNKLTLKMLQSAYDKARQANPDRAAMLQAMIDKSQQHVEGIVRLKLYKGNVMVTGRQSEKSLYSEELVTFEDDAGAYNQEDAHGFIRLNALRLRTLAARNRRMR